MRIAHTNSIELLVRRSLVNLQRQYLAKGRYSQPHDALIKALTKALTEALTEAQTLLNLWMSLQNDK